jgi:hypothetical protein
LIILISTFSDVGEKKLSKKELKKLKKRVNIYKIKDTSKKVIVLLSYKAKMRRKLAKFYTTAKIKWLNGSVFVIVHV